MIHLATTCVNGHIEIVPALGQRDGAPYFGAGATSCGHAIGGEFCGAEIEETQTLCEEHGVLGAWVCPCCEDLEPATGCGIDVPHAPGMHAPPVDLEEDLEEDEEEEEQGCWHYDYTRFCTQCDPASYESSDDEDEDAVVGREVREGSAASFYSSTSSRLRSLLAAEPSTVAVGLLLALGAVASLTFTVLFSLQGRWILALLV